MRALRISLTAAAFAVLALAGADASATTTKPVKNVSESDLAEACEAVGGTFSPSRGEDDGYACDRPDGTGVECHPGGCEAFDTNQPDDFRPRPGKTPPKRPTPAGSTTGGLR